MFNWKRFTKVYIILAAFLLLGVSFLGGIYYGYENRPVLEKVLKVADKKPPAELAGVDFNIFWDVWSKIEEKYVDKAKIERENLVLGAAAGLVRSLKDPHSEFLSPERSKQFKEDIRGSFSGIGAEIGIRRGTLVIISPLKDSPAERAGIKAGDKILKVDDTFTADLTLDEAVRIIRGEQGSEVRLLILRDTFREPREFRIIRDLIRVPIISTERKSDGIFVIKLHHFTETAAFDFRKAVQEFFNSGSQKIILDLRNNPGGFLAISVDIASWWIPSGEPVARERFADGSEDIYRSRGYRLLANVPTVVLVNEGSASASEIVAGALRDNKGIKIVGAKTFGKGSVQEVIALDKGASLKLTIAKWLTPRGEEINGKGLEPDIKVELPKDRELKEDEDPIMEKGIKILKSL